MPKIHIRLAKDETDRNFKRAHFDADLQSAMSRAIGEHSRLAELCRSFPALLVALARMDDTNPVKLNAIAQIDSGASVFAVAQAFGLARWTSYLAPAAISKLTSHPLPDDPNFNTEIINFIPADPKAQRAWLVAIVGAYHWGGRVYALWLARRLIEGMPPPPPDAIRLIALYHRVSSAPQTRLARMMQKRWHSKQSFQSAAFEAHNWLSWVILHTLLGPKGQSIHWRENGAAVGYRFVALATAEDFKNAAEASDNCLYRHAPLLLRDGSNRVYNIYEDSAQSLIGHVEIGLDGQRGGFIRPFEMRGYHNRPLGDAVARAVYAWLATARDPRPTADPGSRSDLVLTRASRSLLPSIPNPRIAENWHALFAEFISADGVPPDWPNPPTMSDLAALHLRNTELKDIAEKLDDLFAAAIRRLEQGLENGS